MKIKQIESILKSKKTIIILNTPSCQWLGDGSAFYPVYNLPKLTQENIFTIFDVPEDKRDKFSFQELDAPTHINLDDDDENEQMLDRSKFVDICAGGRRLEALVTSDGISFIDTRYLKPFADIDDGCELYERIDKSGKPYIAAKTGFVIVGIIKPYDLINDKFINILESMLTLSRAALFNKEKRTPPEDDPDQITMTDE